MRELTDSEYKEILAEDRRRRELYFRFYDPIKGDEAQEVLPRKRMRIENEEFLVPVQMYKDPFVQEYRKCHCSASEMLLASGMEDNEDNRASILDKLINLRFKYDFEFYAAMCLKIQDKVSKKDVPLILNEGQRRIAKRFEEMRLAGEPIRVLLVKSRQYGGSTLTEAYMLWIQDMWHENWHSCVIAKNQKQSVVIRSMMKKMINGLPAYHAKRSFKRYEGQELIRIIAERGCKVQIGSSTEPDAIRGDDLAMLHMSEVGLWKDTKEVKGDDTAQAFASCIPEGVPDTVIVMESTAKGIGNFFHRQYLDALDNEQNHRKGIKPVFVGWFVHDLNLARVPVMKDFVKSMSDYNWWQWEQGATLSGIYWYNQYKASHHWNDFQMKSEYPTTAEEAFQSKSGRYFSDEMLSYLKANVKAPQFTGEIRGDSTLGPGALKNLRLIPNDGLEEPLRVWIQPGDRTIPGKKITNRFLVTVDVGGRSYKADRSVITVVDRLSTTMEFGALERAALWFGHVDPDILAYKAAQIACFYDNALLVVESNTYETKHKKTEENAEGDHTYTVLDTLADIYENIYRRHTSPDKVQDRETMRVGWHMNKQTKYQAYDDYSIRLREGEYVEYSQDAANEAQWLQNTTDGKIEAMEGTHDDIQDTTAVANYISNNNMPVVRIVDENTEKKKYTAGAKGGSGVSSF